MKKTLRRRAAIMREFSAGGITIPAHTDFAVAGESEHGYDLEALRDHPCGLRRGDRVHGVPEDLLIITRGNGGA